MKIYLLFSFFLIVLLSCSINNPFLFSAFDFTGPPEPVISGVIESASYNEVKITVQPVEGITHRTFIDGVEYTQDSTYDITGSHIFQALAKKDSNGLEVIRGINFTITSGPVRVTNAIGDSKYPRMAYNGSQFGIIWEDDRSGAWKLYFTALDSTGNKLVSDKELTDIVLTGGGGTAYTSNIVWNGSEYGIAWEDDRDGVFEIYFNRLDISGNQQIADLRITDSSGDSSRPWITWSGNNSEYGVVWNDNRVGNSEIYFTRVNSAGVKQGGDIQISTGGIGSAAASIISNGSGYGISWTDSRDGDAETFFTAVNSSGSKLLGELNISNDLIQSSCPTLAWTGTEYGLVWYEIANITFVRLNTSGVVQGAELFVDTNSNFFPYVIWTGTEYGIAYERGTGSHIRFSRVNTNSEKIGVDVDFAEDGWGYPTCVWTGSGYAITYDNDGEIYFVMLTADGTVK